MHGIMVFVAKFCASILKNKRHDFELICDIETEGRFIHVRFGNLKLDIEVGMSHTPKDSLNL